jgi:hypothetical protein
MNESIITILGEELTIGFNMAVEIAFEEIAGIPFNTSDAIELTLPAWRGVILKIQ